MAGEVAARPHPGVYCGGIKVDPQKTGAHTDMIEGAFSVINHVCD